ncbi:MAG: FAD-binding oxidoreductase [Alphaproteobacteria bacterium]|nr:FAD-binding oxidoreductase [Alphaproteobacteria bacterium]
MPASAGVLDRLAAIVGPKGVITDPDTMRPFLLDERGKYRGNTPMILRPASTAEVAEIVRVCAETGTAIVPQGGNTSLCGAATPSPAGDAVLVSLTRMNRVRDIDPINYTITVEAGVILADVQAEAARADRLFPLSLGGEGTARIGGNLSTNAGGTGVLRYGNARELVLGVEVVLPDGRVLDLLSGLRKDNTGYDLKQLFIGAEGTLGIITACVLKLFPRAAEVQTAFCAVPTPTAAVELLTRARAASDDRVITFEWIGRHGFDFTVRHIAGARDPFAQRYDHYVLIEIAAGKAGAAALRELMETILGEAMEAGLALDAVIAENTTQARAFWKIRETIPEAQKAEGASIKHDVAVPISRLAEFIATASGRLETAVPGIRICAFGHLGDGNLHFNVSRPIDGADAAFNARQDEINRIVHDLVVEMRGSISAEHGIGQLKRDELVHYKSPVALDVMRTLKAALDPKGIMNPGKVI